MMSFWEAAEAWSIQNESKFDAELSTLFHRLANYMLTGHDTGEGPWSLELYNPSHFLTELEKWRDRLDDPEIECYLAHYHIGTLQ